MWPATAKWETMTIMPEDHMNPFMQRQQRWSASKHFIFVGSIAPNEPGHAYSPKPAELDSRGESALNGRVQFDTPESAVIGQTIAIMDRLVDVLLEAGTDIGRVLRQRILVRDRRDVPAVMRALKFFYAEGEEPALSIICVAAAEGRDDWRVFGCDAIALSGTSNRPREFVTLATSTNGLHANITAGGGLVFIPGLDRSFIANDAFDRDIAALPDVLQDCAYATEQQREITRQMWSTYQEMGRHAARRGMSLTDIVKVNGWITFSMRDFGFVSIVRECILPAHNPSYVTSTGVTISQLAAEDALLSYDAVLADRTFGVAKHVATAPSSLGQKFYVGALQIEDLVFSSGEVPIDLEARHVVDRAERLPERLREYLAAAPLGETDGFDARLLYVYDLISQHLKPYGVTLKDVVHQVVYIRPPFSLAVYERIASLAYGVTLPPTSIIPISDNTPFADCGMEIEVICAKR